jgi:flagellar hook assembly protein FlgD
VKAKIHIENGNTLNLDDFATEMVRRAVINGDLNNSLTVIHIADKNGNLVYSIPLSSVSYIEYGEVTTDGRN